MSSRYFNATAQDVQDGDIIINNGYRCRVSSVTSHEDTVTDGKHGSVARYVLNSEPDDVHTLRLPCGFDGMAAGGNRLAKVAIAHRE